MGHFQELSAYSLVVCQKGQQSHVLPKHWVVSACPWPVGRAVGEEYLRQIADALAAQASSFRQIICSFYPHIANRVGPIGPSRIIAEGRTPK